jgi:hypothetical protein
MLSFLELKGWASSAVTDAMKLLPGPTLEFKQSVYGAAEELADVLQR